MPWILHNPKCDHKNLFSLELRLVYHRRNMRMTFQVPYFSREIVTFAQNLLSALDEGEDYGVVLDTFEKARRQYFANLNIKVDNRNDTHVLCSKLYTSGPYSRGDSGYLHLEYDQDDFRGLLKTLVDADVYEHPELGVDGWVFKSRTLELSHLIPFPETCSHAKLSGEYVKDGMLSICDSTFTGDTILEADLVHFSHKNNFQKFSVSVRCHCVHMPRVLDCQLDTSLLYIKILAKSKIKDINCRALLAGSHDPEGVAKKIMEVNPGMEWCCIIEKDTDEWEMKDVWVRHNGEIVCLESVPDDEELTISHAIIMTYPQSQAENEIAGLFRDRTDVTWANVGDFGKNTLVENPHQSWYKHAFLSLPRKPRVKSARSAM